MFLPKFLNVDELFRGVFQTQILSLHHTKILITMILFGKSWKNHIFGRLKLVIDYESREDAIKGFQKKGFFLFIEIVYKVAMVIASKHPVLARQSNHQSTK